MEFMKDEIPEQADMYSAPLWDLGFRSFAAIANAFRLSRSAMQVLLDPDDKDDEGLMHLSMFARSNSGEQASPAHPVSKMALPR